MAQEIKGKSLKPTIGAAQKWIADCLIEDKSIFSNDKLWTADNIGEVRRAFVDHPDLGKDSFSTKLHGQMDTSSPSSKRLMAEMIWALLLFPTNIKAVTKRQQFQEMWLMSGAQVDEKHPMLTEDILSGIGSGGPGFNNHRWRELGFLISIAESLKKLNTIERKKIFTEYSVFVDWIGAVTQEGHRQFRHMLRYFSFSDRVERMSSNRHRRAVLKGFGIASEEVTKSWNDQELDAALLTLRQKLGAEYPNEVLDFYEPPLRERWNHIKIVDEEPDQDAKCRFWVEKTLVEGRPDRQAGDHALGKALWSPQRANGNRDLYRCMREVRKGDIVFHFVDNKNIIGISVADNEADDTFKGVDGTEWDRRPCYRIPLSDYRPLAAPVNRSEFLTSRKYKERIDGMLDRYRGLFFNREYNLNQGSYITEAPIELVQLWDEIYRDKTGGALLPGIDLGSPVHSIEHNISAANLTIDSEIIDEFEKALGEAGLMAGRNFIVRFMASLASNRFMLLTGLSGSGKTKLAQALSRWLTTSNNSYRLVAVGADWTSNEALLGYVDALKTKSYRKPENGVLGIILRARTDPNRPYFIILDEMNLSHVERYFADFLSSMESGEEISLHDGDEREIWDGVPGKVKIPENVFVIGTVNVDETTYMFSPKVLDRANVVEFRVDKNEMASFLAKPSAVNIDEIIGKGERYAQAFTALSAEVNTAMADEIRESIAAVLLEFFPSLKDVGAEFGYRTANEICRLVYFHKILSGDEWELNEAMDAAIMQKLLPKLHGSKKKLEKVLAVLQALCVGKYPVSSEKISRMQNRLSEHGFTSFAEA